MGDQFETKKQQLIEKAKNKNKKEELVQYVKGKIVIREVIIILNLRNNKKEVGREKEKELINMLVQKTTFKRVIRRWEISNIEEQLV